MHAATDVTGFGLLGHLREMCAASGIGVIVDAAAVPVIAGVPGPARRRAWWPVAPSATYAFVAPDVDFGDLPDAEQLLLADAQTSGGLLLSVAPDRAQRWLTPA